MTSELLTNNTLDYDQEKRVLNVPRNTLIILCGPSGCGKSTFAAAHFPLSSIVSTDNCRSMVSDDARNMECSEEAFDLAYTIVHKRLKLGRTTIFDSTALTSHYRQKLREIAYAHNFKTLLLVLQTPFQTCHHRDSERIWPAPVGKEVLMGQFVLFNETLHTAIHEAFDLVLILESNSINKVTVLVN